MRPEASLSFPIRLGKMLHWFEAGERAMSLSFLLCAIEGRYGHAQRSFLQLDVVRVIHSSIPGC
jgi:hypothetical protein